MDRAVSRDQRPSAANHTISATSGHGLANLVDDGSQPLHQGPQINRIYQAGNALLRTEGAIKERVLVNAEGLPIITSQPTAESALMPYMFPRGKGFMTASHNIGLKRYASYRAFQLFSSFSLHVVYVLLLYQMLLTQQLSSGGNRSVLETALKEYQAQHPLATEQEAIKHIAKYDVPKTVDGSSAYWRGQLQNLCAAADSEGLPDLFLTLTCDEVTHLKYVHNDRCSLLWLLTVTVPQ
jgi:Helitron helicase-like domain at N-terminus